MQHIPGISFLNLRALDRNGMQEDLNQRTDLSISYSNGFQPSFSHSSSVFQSRDAHFLRAWDVDRPIVCRLSGIIDSIMVC